MVNSSLKIDQHLEKCRLLGWTLTLLAMLGSAPPSHAQIIPPSVLPGLGPGAAREAVDATRPPWRGVVRVQTDIGVHCTGALVGPRTILTAAHCLFARNTGRMLRSSAIHVLTGYTHGDYAGHARAVSVEIGASFAVGLDGQLMPSAPPDSDWAVLHLDASLGTADRLLPLMREIPPPGTPAMLGGYEQDRAQIIVADVACTVVGVVRAREARMLRHSCAATRGASGAPLLVRTPDAGWGIAGVASGAVIGAAGGYAVPLATIAARANGLP